MYEIEGYPLDIDIPEKPIYCSIEEMQFTRVLENIMGNTVKYNEVGTSILVRVTVEDNKACIKIGDNGVGIPDRYKESIMEPFVVGDEARGQVNGSGLGLSLVKRIVELFEGDVYLKMEPDEGFVTEFVIELPVTGNDETLRNLKII